MLYLIDANVLIHANNQYYPLKVVPEFWDWLVHMGESDRLKIPLEIYEEIKEGTDDLAAWIGQSEIEEALVLDEEVDVAAVATVIDKGYAPDLSDIEIEKLGRDPFLVAYAIVDPSFRIVVTTEVSKPSKQRGNRKVPDVAASFDVDTCNTFELVKLLGFSTGWRN